MHCPSSTRQHQKTFARVYENNDIIIIIIIIIITVIITADR